MGYYYGPTKLAWKDGNGSGNLRRWNLGSGKLISKGFLDALGHNDCANGWGKGEVSPEEFEIYR
jgi:hypothetical protein